MSEELKKHTPKEKPSGSSGDFTGADSEPTGTVMVGSGVYLENLPVCGMTVKQVRDKFADRMDIAPEADAFIDGKQATPDTVLKVGNSLRFAHKAGEKG